MRPEQYEAFTRSLVRSLEGDDRVVGLVALGSMAAIDYAPDEWSDHDFFVITTAGAQEEFRSNLGWLPEHETIALSFRETAHGLKVLYRSGHLLEFAVFDPDELRFAQVNRYRVLIDRADIASRMAARVSETGEAAAAEASEEFLWGQFLSNVIVGAGRFARGERLSGGEFIRGHALRHLILLLRRRLDPARRSVLDNLDVRRRYELADQEYGRSLARIADLPPLEAADHLLKLAKSALPDAPVEAMAIVERAVRRASEATRSDTPLSDRDERRSR